MTSALAAAIRTRLASLAEDPDANDGERQEVALDAVCLHADVGGWIAIRPDGEMISVPPT